jgi:hypothetical protein
MALLGILLFAGQAFVGIVFVRTGATKLRDPIGTRIAVLDYRLIPARAAGIAALGLGAAELLVGLGLLAGLASAALGGVVLLALFSGAAASALVRGLDIDCHCFGEGEKLSPATVSRNAALAAPLLAGLLLGAPSSLLAPQLLHAPLPYLLSVGSGVAIVAAAVAAVRVNRWPQASTRG